MGKKVFEVIVEVVEESGEVVREKSYVTSEENTLASVCGYFTKKCAEFDTHLLSVAEVVTIVQHIERNEK